MSGATASKPKLAFLIPNFSGGGAEAMTIRLAGEFARRGHEVDLVVFRPEGENASEVSPDLRLVDLKVRHLLLAPLAIRRYLLEAKPAVLISALFYANVLALLARVLAPGLKARLVVTERVVLSVHVKHSKRFTRHLFKPIAWLLYRFADRVIGVSEGVAADIGRIARLPSSKVGFIHNPTVSPEMVERSRRPVATPLAPPSEEPTVITLGRLEAQKDHDTLLRAFAILQRTVPSRLIILGQGSLRGRMDELIAELGLEERVFLPGYVDNPLPHLRAADLFVLSSLYEGLPNVVIEALACGLPVVSTDCPSGPMEILGGGDYGRLVPMGDREALAAAMAEALQASRDPARQEARAQEFSLDRCADRYETLLRELLS